MLISGGVRVKDVKAEWACTATDFSAADTRVSEAELFVINNEIDQKENTLVIRSSNRGDFSTYMLSLVESVDAPDTPATGFDVMLSKVEFSFKVECPSDFDCASAETQLQRDLVEPVIDYMAKDYASFRRLMLDRLSLILPDWKERNPADVGIMLVELMAYVGDHLSYFQDAVASEAYLETARRRVSAVRQARLLDYSVHDGCNARAWVCFKCGSDGISLPKKTVLLTRAENDQNIIVRGDDVEFEVAKGAEAFETMYDTNLYESKNNLSFYSWDETNCWLPAGSTSATIENTVNKIEIFTWEKVPGDDTEDLTKFLARNFEFDWLERAAITKSGDTVSFSYEDNTVSLTMGEHTINLYVNGSKVYEFDVSEDPTSHEHSVLSSSLQVGDILIFEEKSLSSGGTADPSHRHAVRLTSVTTSKDDLTGTPVLEIEWNQEDALPFSLCVVKDGQPISNIYGNVVLADHGYTRTEDLKTTIVTGEYYPKLSRKPLTQAGPDFDASAGSGESAASAFNYEIRSVKPDISLVDGDGLTWLPQRDLLSSDEFAREFVVETENDGSAFIRFDNSNKASWANEITEGSFTPLNTTYRIGNGKMGNVGAGSIKRLFIDESEPAISGLADIQEIFNPMPASGGEDPEVIESVRQHAPQAFRVQERAVTESDYAEVLKRHPQVQRAVATKTWTGSWYTMFVAVDRVGGKPVDEAFKSEIMGFLERYRLAGYDVEIQEPIYVPLTISLYVCMKKGYFAGELKEELLKAFSNRVDEDGRKGFFHPDNFTFGQPLYLSRIYEAAMEVEGVASVNVTVFQRWGKSSYGEIDDGVINVEKQEIIRLDNDPNFAENGKIEFNLRGGS
ncbi:MAG: putative baseplate assembly protein [Thaumarchaeota archaeon]|nr:putative baseplate assembly protein [Nitrososphaerota archaeon]MCL5317201.1 putative baseplate assembly protein [Nitrososphaerota archaeon]